MVNINEIYENLISESNEIWYHGTPDVREIEKNSGFSERTKAIEYVTDLDSYLNLQNKMEDARENNNEDLYFKLIDEVPKLKSYYRFNKPIFVTNDKKVASTYTDAHRSMDYQGSKSKILKVSVNVNKVATIIATGDRFRFINMGKVKDGFIKSGVNVNDLEEVISKFTFQQSNKNGIQTDTIAAIGHWFGFDCIDVLGVLDSYDGGSIESTVRMIFNPSSIKILN